MTTPQPPEQQPTPTILTTILPTQLRPLPTFLSFPLSLPVSLSDATTRLSFNLSYFQSNYLLLTLLIITLSLLPHPLSLLLFLSFSFSWLYLLSNFDTLSLSLPFDLDHRVVTAVFGLITVIALVWMNVWGSLFVGLAVSVGVVVLHGVLKAPSDGEFDPYGGLLDHQDGDYSDF